MNVQQSLALGSAIVKFQSKDEVRRYLKILADYYQNEVDGIGSKAGDLLRDGPAPVEEKEKDKRDKKDAKGGPNSWFRIGTLMVNASDVKTAETEISLQLLKEYKAKAASVNDALKSFDESAAMSLPDSSEYMVYLRNGVPERILVNSDKKKPPAFAFAARFRVV